MEVMGLIAIIVNCYLIGQCGQLQRLFPWLSPEMAIISIVILEVRQVLCLITSSESRIEKKDLLLYHLFKFFFYPLIHKSVKIEANFLLDMHLCSGLCLK